MNIHIFFTLCMIFTAGVLFSQNTDTEINKIDSLRAYTENHKYIFKELQTDGLIIKRRRIFGITLFSSTRGGFYETYYCSDTSLVRLVSGTRRYTNRKKTLGTNTVNEYLFDKGNLCYYEEDKYFEEYNKPDSLIYSVKYYLKNNQVLKFTKKGSFTIDKDLFIERIIIRSNYKKENCL